MFPLVVPDAIFLMVYRSGRGRGGGGSATSSRDADMTNSMDDEYGAAVPSGDRRNAAGRREDARPTRRLSEDDARVNEAIKRAASWRELNAILETQVKCCC